jgi:hypothetical protein
LVTHILGEEDARYGGEGVGFGFDDLTIYDLVPAERVADKVLVVLLFYVWRLQVDAIETSEDGVVSDGHETSCFDILINGLF